MTKKNLQNNKPQQTEEPIDENKLIAEHRKKPAALRDVQVI